MTSYLHILTPVFEGCDQNRKKSGKNFSINQILSYNILLFFRQTAMKELAQMKL